MDVLEELDLFGAFVLATSINPELAIEYHPVFITGDIEMGIIKMLINRFPHMLGRPWTPQGMCVEFQNNKIVVYNGFITNIVTNQYYVWRISDSDKSWYESFSTDNGRYTTNPDNLLIDYWHYGDFEPNVTTKFGKYTKKRSGVIHREVMGRINTVEIVNNYQLKKTYYTIDGTPVSGVYSGALFDGIPAGLSDYYDVQNPAIQTIKCTGNIPRGNSGLIIPWDKPPPKQNMPIIRSLADLVANFPTFE